MSPCSRFLASLSGICLILAAPTPGHGQEGYPPGLEVRPASPDVSQQVVDPAHDPGGLTCPPLFAFARQQTRWYADGEMAVLFNTAVHFNGEFTTIRDNNAFYLSPRIYLGRRLESGASVRFTYRNLTEVGYVGAGYDSPDWSSSSTFTTNWFDLDLVSREYAPLRWWRLQCELGGRFVFHHQSWTDRSSFSRYDSRQNFFGGGPHLGLMSHVLFGESGWALYGRADTAVSFGGGEATFRYQPIDFPGWPSSERESFSAVQFDLGLQLALVRRWEWRGRAVGFGAGFQADVLSRGNLEGEFNSYGLVNIGPFLRLEVGY
jgi:hypothetical protein